MELYLVECEVVVAVHLARCSNLVFHHQRRGTAVHSGRHAGSLRKSSLWWCIIVLYSSPSGGVDYYEIYEEEQQTRKKNDTRGQGRED